MSIVLNGTTGITTPDVTSDGLTVDSTTLVVDEANNRVGVGTSSPLEKLHVAGVIQTSSGIKVNDTNPHYFYSVGASQIGVRFNDGATATGYMWLKNFAPSINGIGVSSGALAFGTASTERMRIDSAGRVTMPYQPCFSAWYAASGSVSTVGATLPFDTTHVNVGNHYSTSTNRFTAPVAGVYQFSWTALYRNANYQIVSLYKNGANIWDQGPLHVTNHSSSEATLGSTVFINLASGDYVDVRLYSISGGDAYYGRGHANFTGRLVG